MAKEALASGSSGAFRSFRFCLEHSGFDARSSARSTLTSGSLTSSLAAASRPRDDREKARASQRSIDRSGRNAAIIVGPDIKAAAVYLPQLSKTRLYFPRHAATRPHINSRHGASQVAQKMTTTDSRNNNGRKLMMAGINGQRVATGDVPA
jgi:hypothetical protein